MTEIQSDEAQETNGEDQEEVRPQPLWEQYGMSRESCSEAIEQSHANTRKLDNAEIKIEKAGDLLNLLRQADETTCEDYDLSVRAIYVLEQVQSLLKSAVKKITKYGEEQFHRDIKNWHEPRNLELGADRGKEQKELVQRLDALPKDEAMEVISMYINLGLSKQNGDEERRTEIFQLLETQPVPWVNAYAHLAQKGLVQLVSEKDQNHGGAK